jgi:hypothetical protein
MSDFAISKIKYTDVKINETLDIIYNYYSENVDFKSAEKKCLKYCEDWCGDLFEAEEFHELLLWSYLGDEKALKIVKIILED